MSEIDRSALIEQLEAVSDEDDTKALEAAREAVRMLSSAGLSWDDVLTPDNSGESEDDDVDAPQIDLSDLPDDEAELVSMLLARDDLNDDTRDDLETFQKDIAEGSLATEDRRYLKALVGRLGSK